MTREEAAQRICAATAKIWFEAAHPSDPYGTRPVDPDREQIVRVAFVADPVDRVGVLLLDLPDATAAAVAERIREYDDSWAELIRIVNRVFAFRELDRHGAHERHKAIFKLVYH